MKRYDEFHGEVSIKDIGKRIRDIVKLENDNFKILTGYGSSTGKCKSKDAAIKTLTILKKEGKIKNFIPGEYTNKLLDTSSHYFNCKITYLNIIKKDPDYGNDGIIFVFMK